ncbi:macrophage migration inhibitory factor-like [Protopterus annectens]|uniref:macrophage migration inhibitory factor-like n=1 Tax=Protopterus annectens TaxID=7888 RepID=UPI001CFBF5A0|nr:macrophage migration inhibitory factor-like [Protopterus annectens]
MSLLIVNTSVPGSAVTESLFEELRQELGKDLPRSVQQIAIQINTDQRIRFAGTKEPSALCTLLDTGHIDLSDNKNHAKIISDVLTKNLKISADRIYIHFTDVPAANAGWKGTTLDFL